MKDEELEQIIEKSFCAEPDYHLPLDFAKKVNRIVLRYEQSKNNWQEYLNIAVIIIFLLAMATGIYYFNDREFLTKSIDFMAKNKIPIVFISVITSFILVADRVLLPFLFNRRNRT